MPASEIQESMIMRSCHRPTDYPVVCTGEAVSVARLPLSSGNHRQGCGEVGSGFHCSCPCYSSRLTMPSSAHYLIGAREKEWMSDRASTSSLPHDTVKSERMHMHSSTNVSPRSPLQAYSLGSARQSVTYNLPARSVISIRA